MFENMIKEVEHMNGKSISVPIEPDEKGYIDKQCHSKECEFIFKVNKEDWTNIFKDEAVWCPFCRHEDSADQWCTIEQIEHAKAEVITVFHGKIHNALRKSSHKFNRSQPKNSVISMSMKVQGGIKRTHIIPSKVAEAMQLEIICEECNSRFAVIGSAYFCPACGHNSVTRTFSDSLRKIKAKRDSIEIIRVALNESIGKDEAELTCRSTIETCISDGVVAFQKYCEGLYADFGKVPFNAFQRLEDGSNLWVKVVQKGYSDWLTPGAFSKLKVLYQKRHILLHNEGIVNSIYIKKSGDSSYKEGQRIVVSNKDIDDLVRCLEKLSNGLKEACNSEFD